MFAILGKYERARLPGQAVKTLASHAGIRGSIPLGVTEKSSYLRAFFVLKNLLVNHG